MVSLRNPKTLAIFRLQAADRTSLFAEHLRSEGFTEIKSSKLIGSGTEGGTGLFAVEYFDRTVYLAQSPQLYKQAMVAAGPGTGVRDRHGLPRREARHPRATSTSTSRWTWRWRSSTASTT